MPGLVVHPAVIARHVAEQLPFMATENLLMAAVQAGGDRQDLHERIRVHAMAASEQLKNGAADNDLLDRIRNDPAFPRLDFEGILDPGRYTGRSARQVDEFVADGRSSRFATDILTASESRTGFVRCEFDLEQESAVYSDPGGHMLASLA